MALPYLDAYGQVRQLDWKGKLKSRAALVSRQKRDAHELVMNPGPDMFDEYGGWANGPKLEATGFFRAEEYKNRWWLVDPSGGLFFSHGVNSVGFTQKTPVNDREGLFEWLPDADNSYIKDVFTKREGSFYCCKFN